MKRLAILVAVLAMAGAATWYVRSQSVPPTVVFTKASRASVSNVVSTNGKLEPVDYTELRVDSAGLIDRLLVKSGDAVAKDQTIAVLSLPGIDEAIEAATQREAQARAELSVLEQGGPAANTAEIEGSIGRLRNEREVAVKNADTLDRLVKKQAATSFEAEQAHEAVHSLDVQIASLERRRQSLVSPGDLAAAQAKLREANVNLREQRNRRERTFLRSPAAGTIYDLPPRTGTFLNPGDVVARIGKLDPLRVRVYVDEPELGRVKPGQNVRITWDGLAGEEWTGTVTAMPTEIVPLGSRQVGEVLCLIDNSKRLLVPGSNVNAFILTDVVANALTVSKSAIRHGNGTGVFLLGADGTVKWQTVSTGLSDALRIEVTGGLKEGDAVSASSDVALNNGDRVTASFQ